MAISARVIDKSHKSTAIILAGGLSTRMGGQSKSHLMVGGIAMIEHIVNQLKGHFGQILISANPNQDFGFLKIPVIVDIEQEKGPLMGLYSCLMASKTEINFVTTCDNPNPNLDLIWEMIAKIRNKDAAVPISPSGKIDPLFAIYKKSVAEKAKNLLDQDIRKVMKLLEITRVEYVETSYSNEIININKRTDYENFLRDTPF